MLEKRRDPTALWLAFTSGDEEAFAQLFFDYYPICYRYGLKLVPDEALVKDVIQDFFLYLLKNRGNLTVQVDNITSYLIASYRRRLLREIDIQRVDTERRSSMQSSQAILFSIGPEEIMINQESSDQNKDKIVQLLNELPPRQREIIYLKYYHDLSLPEIADTLSISYQVVANHLYRALKKLRTSNLTKRHANLKIPSWIYWVILLWT